MRKIQATDSLRRPKRCPSDARTTGIAGLSAVLGGGARRYAGGEEGLQARRGVVALLELGE